MRLSRHVFLVTAFAACVLLLSTASAGESDQAAAARILGPQWRQLSRRAGMVFAGTVLTDIRPTARADRNVPAVEVRLHVDRAVAGVETGQFLTIHEWTGALSRHPAMRRGERFLLFLYPPSRLGLTSPVGGSQGQLRLDSFGATVIEQEPMLATAVQRGPGRPPGSAGQSLNHPAVTLLQLERAIRAARGE